jgi:hypothetical protein
MQACLPLEAGYEFRPVHVLSPLCGRHPLWLRVAQWLTEAVYVSMTPISNSKFREDVVLTLVRGNHKSAQVETPRIVTMLLDEVAHGWQLILPKDAALLLPHTVLAPPRTHSPRKHQ